VPYGDFIPQKALIVDQSDVVQFVRSFEGSDGCDFRFGLSIYPR